MYKLEFGLPKFNMYRRILAKVLADDFVRTGVTSETGAVALARQVLRDNVRRIFKV
jgi:glucuronate isomerase